jgi:ATP-dependent Lon protease
MEEKSKETIRKIPIVAIRASSVFPHTDAILTFGRKKSVSAINSAFQSDRVVAIFTQKDARTADPREEDIYKIGTIATITQMMSTEGEVHAVVRGQARVKLDEIISDSPHLIGEVTEIPEQINNTPQVKALAKKVSELFKKAINLGKQAEIATVIRLVSGQTAPNELVDQVASLLEIPTNKKQKLLETLSIKDRLQRVHKHLTAFRRSNEESDA